MKKLMVILIIGLFLLTPSLAAEGTEEVVDNPDAYDVLRIVLAVLGSVGFTATTFLAISARKTVKKVGSLTFLTDLILNTIERFGTLNDKTKESVGKGLEVLSQFPIVNRLTKKADSLIEQRLIDVEDKIAVWKTKLEGDIFEGDSLKTAQEQIKYLETIKAKIKAELDEKDGS